jgi:hypothetical protein
MKLSKRRQRTARKLVLPLIAVGIMMTMMYIDSRHAPSRAQVTVRP